MTTVLGCFNLLSSVANAAIYTFDSQATVANLVLAVVCLVIAFWFLVVRA